MESIFLNLKVSKGFFYILILDDVAPGALLRHVTETLQMNVGIYCNQACSHCHVESSPKRLEMMGRKTVDKCLDLLRHSPQVHTVDVTGILFFLANIDSVKSIGKFFSKINRQDRFCLH